MDEKRSTVPVSHFDRLYSLSDDPWNYVSSSYENNKYLDSIETLAEKSFDDALEVGCSIGVFTRRLAQHCKHLTAVDCSEKATNSARVRCEDLPHVRFQTIAVPGEWPEGRFDLVVLSEILYLLSDADLLSVVSRVESCLRSSGKVLLVNFTMSTKDPLTGDEAARLFITASGHFLRPLIRKRRLNYRIDLLTR